MMRRHDDHLPAFTGKGRTVLQYDLLACNRVSKDLLKLDHELMEMKWADYRPLHPVEATYLFIHTYAMIYREAYARDVDHKRAEDLECRGFGVPDQLLHANQAEVTAWWKARQAADAVGARYSVFIRSIFSHARSIGWTIYPKPNHLYDGDLLEIAIQAWDTEAAAYVQRPESDVYKANSAFWDKPGHDRRIVAQILDRGNEGAAFPALVERGLLTLKELDYALAHLANDALSAPSL